MKFNKYFKTALMALVAVVTTGSFSSCSDEPDSEYFYTFTGEMMSDYIKNREQYSEFTTIVERANLMDLLSTYGQYTLFLPNNKAIDEYLQSRDLSSVSDLSDEDCDTIARTHIVQNMYSTFEMSEGTLSTGNLLGRYIATKPEFDADSNAVIQLEGKGFIIYRDTLENGEIVHQNDSVENGIVQPITSVIQKSNKYIADILGDNKNIGLFYEALDKTGVRGYIYNIIRDDSYEQVKEEALKNQKQKVYYKSHVWNEVAWMPDERKFGFTVFIETDSVYNAAFEKYGIDTIPGKLHALYELACKLYDPAFPDDVDKPEHSFDSIACDINPLKRFIQYHIMTRYVPNAEALISRMMKETKEPFGFDTKLVNPTEWYTTLLPHTMLKISLLTMLSDEQTPKQNCRGGEAAGSHFINRLWHENTSHTFRGAKIMEVEGDDYVIDALNGRYFYIDDVIAFTRDVIDKIHNTRIRMDFSTVFPEVMTNSLRQVGNYMVDDQQGTPDDANEPVNGKNFYFPDGYLDGVTINNGGLLVLRRPHYNFWSWQGDEWNLFGDYDMTFRIPPVPFSGEWQLRLGFCAIPTRGIMQVYFDGVPQGIPLDMTKNLNTEMYLGDRFGNNGGDDVQLTTYNKMSAEQKAEEQKLLKNLGAYRDGRSQVIGATARNRPMGTSGMYRRIICQTYIDATRDHYIRFRVASEGSKGNNNEFMFDFWEMVPKSVYSVDSNGAMEDDL